MTRYWYDTEFVEDGRTIDLISIGIVADDGREYYAIVDDAPTIGRAVNRDWLRENVVPSLPVHVDSEDRRSWAWDMEHPDYSAVKERHVIAAEVRGFLLGDTPGKLPPIELWAWFGSYDHVALSQLWGRMIDHPEGIPMWTNDIRQECHRLGDPQMPEQESGEHNALADARHNRVMDQFLRRLAFRRQAEAIVAAERGITNA